MHFPNYLGDAMNPSKNKLLILIILLTAGNFIFSKKTLDFGKPFIEKGFMAINLLLSTLGIVMSYMLWVLKYYYQELFIEIMFVALFAAIYVWEMFVIKNYLKKFSRIEGRVINNSTISKSILFYGCLLLSLPISIFLIYNGEVINFAIIDYINSALVLTFLNPLFILAFKILFPTTSLTQNTRIGDRTWKL